MSVGTILSSIGNTPLVFVDGVYAKFEGANPSGSTKDRVALAMIEKAEQDGTLVYGGAIIEPTSGNMGISLALVSAAKGYSFTAVIQEHFSAERKNMIRALGGNIFETSSAKGFTFSYSEAQRIARERKAFMPDQFHNPINIEAHEKHAQEVLDNIGPVDAIVIGVGTGGTLMGYANIMRAANPKVKIFSVEPAEWMVLFNAEAKQQPHKIHGIGTSPNPDLVDRSIIDESLGVSSEDAIAEAKRLAQSRGLLVGFSSGANMVAARRIKEKFNKVVTVLPDRSDRYYSMGILER